MDSLSAWSRMLKEERMRETQREEQIRREAVAATLMALGLTEVTLRPEHIYDLRNRFISTERNHDHSITVKLLRDSEF